MSGSTPASPQEAVAWQRACELAALREGVVHACDGAGLDVVLVRLGERVHALQATCTHGDANLADAEVKGGEIECPFHGGRFDIATGAVTALPCTQPLPTFPVRIVDGTVEVAAPSLFDSKEGA